MEKLRRSLELSRELMTSLYPTLPRGKKRGTYRTYHFCFVWRRNRLLTVGYNKPDKPSPKVSRLFKRFSIRHPFLSLHAETDAIVSLWGREWIDRALDFVVIRLDKWGNLRYSRPCWVCGEILNQLDVSVYYSTEKGIING